jgi:7-carboxy-7-deazaguanine synthase
MQNKFRVAEVFGPTIQGEGNQAGQLCYFVRFGACDYRCSWCDSMHAVLPEHVKLLPELTTPEIVDRVNNLPGFAKWVILSGGNPLLWDLQQLVYALQNAGYQVAVETQGSAYKYWMTTCNNVVISPKPPSSGMETDFVALSQVMDRLQACETPHILKVVVFGTDDLLFAQGVHKRYPDVPFYLSVGTVAPNNEFVKKLAVDSTQNIIDRFQWLLETVTELEDMQDVCLLPQLHVILWGHKLGV